MQAGDEQRKRGQCQIPAIPSIATADRAARTETGWQEGFN